MAKKVAIIGGGISGLACALELQQNGLSPRVFERTDSVGGRIKTDRVDGFLLDRGFQVFLPAYPMGKYYLDYDDLHLNSFAPGALIFKQDQVHALSDPLRNPAQALTTLLSPLATPKDKLLTLRLIWKAQNRDKMPSPETNALDFLKSFGFSQMYIENFFIPFFSGVFLTKNLKVPADYFLFLFSCFSSSLASLPKGGMKEIPSQMAKKLGEQNITFRSTKSSEDLLREGFDHVFVAHANGSKQSPPPEFYGVKTMYFKTQSEKRVSKTLYLNADTPSAVNHVACLTAVSSSYAPTGWHLYSVNALGANEADIEKDLRKMFGDDEIDQWTHLKTYDVQKALPALPQYGKRPLSPEKNISLCGDHLESPSIQGALLSGRTAARRFLGLAE